MSAMKPNSNDVLFHEFRQEHALSAKEMALLEARNGVSSGSDTTKSETESESGSTNHRKRDTNETKPPLDPHRTESWKKGLKVLERRQKEKGKSIGSLAESQNSIASQTLSHTMSHTMSHTLSHTLSQSLVTQSYTGEDEASKNSQEGEQNLLDTLMHNLSHPSQLLGISTSNSNPSTPSNGSGSNGQNDETKPMQFTQNSARTTSPVAGGSFDMIDFNDVFSKGGENQPQRTQSKSNEETTTGSTTYYNSSTTYESQRGKQSEKITTAEDLKKRFQSYVELNPATEEAEGEEAALRERKLTEDITNEHKAEESTYEQEEDSNLNLAPCGSTASKGSTTSSKGKKWSKRRKKVIRSMKRSKAKLVDQIHVPFPHFKGSSRSRANSIDVTEASSTQHQRRTKPRLSVGLPGMTAKRLSKSYRKIANDINSSVSAVARRSSKSTRSIGHSASESSKILERSQSLPRVPAKRSRAPWNSLSKSAQHYKVGASEMISSLRRSRLNKYEGVQEDYLFNYSVAEKEAIATEQVRPTSPDHTQSLYQSDSEKDVANEVPSGVVATPASVRQESSSPAPTLIFADNGEIETTVRTDAIPETEATASGTIHAAGERESPTLEMILGSEQGLRNRVVRECSSRETSQRNVEASSQLEKPGIGSQDSRIEATEKTCEDSEAQERRPWEASTARLQPCTTAGDSTVFTGLSEKGLLALEEAEAEASRIPFSPGSRKEVTSLSFASDQESNTVEGDSTTFTGLSEKGLLALEEAEVEASRIPLSPSAWPKERTWDSGTQEHNTAGEGDSTAFTGLSEKGLVSIEEAPAEAGSSIQNSMTSNHKMSPSEFSDEQILKAREDVSTVGRGDSIASFSQPSLSGSKILERFKEHKPMDSHEGVDSSSHEVDEHQRSQEDVDRERIPMEQGHPITLPGKKKISKWRKSLKARSEKALVGNKPDDKLPPRPPEPVNDRNGKAKQATELGSNDSGSRLSALRSSDSNGRNNSEENNASEEFQRAMNQAQARRSIPAMLSRARIGVAVAPAPLLARASSAPGPENNRKPQGRKFHDSGRPRALITISQINDYATRRNDESITKSSYATQRNDESITKSSEATFDEGRDSTILAPNEVSVEAIAKSRKSRTEATRSDVTDFDEEEAMSVRNALRDETKDEDDDFWSPLRGSGSRADPRAKKTRRTQKQNQKLVAEDGRKKKARKKKSKQKPSRDKGRSKAPRKKNKQKSLKGPQRSDQSTDFLSIQTEETQLFGLPQLVSEFFNIAIEADTALAGCVDSADSGDDDDGGSTLERGTFETGTEDGVEKTTKGLRIPFLDDDTNENDSSDDEDEEDDDDDESEVNYSSLLNQILAFGCHGACQEELPEVESDVSSVTSGSGIGSTLAASRTGTEIVVDTDQASKHDAGVQANDMPSEWIEFPEPQVIPEDVQETNLKKSKGKKKVVKLKKRLMSLVKRKRKKTGKTRDKGSIVAETELHSADDAGVSHEEDFHAIVAAERDDERNLKEECLISLLSDEASSVSRNSWTLGSDVFSGVTSGGSRTRDKHRDRR